MFSGFEFLILCLHFVFFYKQLALEWQIAKQRSGLSPLLLGNNKNYRLKKSGVFPL